MPRCRIMMNRPRIVSDIHLVCLIVYRTKIFFRINPHIRHTLHFIHILQPLCREQFRCIFYHCLEIQPSIGTQEMKSGIQAEDFRIQAKARIAAQAKAGLQPRPRPGATANAVAPGFASFSHPIKAPRSIISSIDLITSTSVSKYIPP